MGVYLSTENILDEQIEQFRTITRDLGLTTEMGSEYLPNSVNFWNDPEDPTRYVGIYLPRRVQLDILTSNFSNLSKEDSQRLLDGAINVFQTNSWSIAFPTPERINEHISVYDFQGLPYKQ